MLVRGEELQGHDAWEEAVVTDEFTVDDSGEDFGFIYEPLAKLFLTKMREKAPIFLGLITDHALFQLP